MFILTPVLPLREPVLPLREPVLPLLEPVLPLLEPVLPLLEPVLLEPVLLGQTSAPLARQPWVSRQHRKGHCFAWPLLADRAVCPWVLARKTLQFAHSDTRTSVGSGQSRHWRQTLFAPSARAEPLVPIRIAASRLPLAPLGGDPGHPCCLGSRQVQLGHLPPGLRMRLASRALPGRQVGLGIESRPSKPSL